MAKAYVMMNCDLGSEIEIIKSLEKIGGVKEAHGIFGLYDLIIQVELDSENAIQDTVTKTIRKMSKIHSTMTLIQSESEELFQKSEISKEDVKSSQAYVVIHCDKGNEFSILKDLCHIPEIRNADVVFGLYDVICKIESPDEGSLQNIILKKVRRLPKIKSCMTLNILN